jgi:hypothetical protein
MLRLAAILAAFLMLASTDLRGVSGDAPLPVANQSPIDWDSSAINLSPECGKRHWAPWTGSCALQMTLDSMGRVHVFIMKRASAGELQREIEHYLISEGEIHQLDSVPILHADLITFRTASAPSGEIYLLKAENLGRVTLQTYREGSWEVATSILDEKARPWVYDSSDIALSVRSDSSIDVFWRDGREYHFLADVLSMGHAGNYDKTYHRRLTKKGWSSSEQVQPRGRDFIPSDFRAMPGPDSSIDLLWSMSSSPAAKIVRSSFVKGKWSEEGTVGQCRSRLGTPGIHAMDILDDTRGTPKVAWSCLRYESTGQGTLENDLFANLYVSLQVGDQWQTGPALSRNATTFRWLGGRKGKSYLLLQESSTGGRGRNRNVPLLVMEMSGNKAVSTSRIVEHTVVDFLEVATSQDGIVHLIYAVPTSDSEAILVYRRGRITGE